MIPAPKSTSVLVHKHLSQFLSRLADRLTVPGALILTMTSDAGNREDDDDDDDGRGKTLWFLLRHHGG